MLSLFYVAIRPACVAPSGEKILMAADTSG
jgi:hypothetical protein